MIRIDGVSKSFLEGVRRQRVQALSELSLAIGEGEVFGFLGPNGAGKSTTIKLLLNLIRPDCGTATIAGGDVADPAVRRRIGFLPENPYFYDHLSADELLWFGGKTCGMTPSAIDARSELLLHRVDLLAARGRSLRTYSKGMLQRAGLALALIHDPDVVILDEPMSGLDPVGRRLVVDLILELKSQGKTVFFSSHILSDIERICDRVGIIAGGRLRLCGALSELLTEAGSLESVFLDVVRKADGGEVC
ncbi:MAG: ABC transporter ATP-binding protein [Desulfuromonadales bacterium]|nr:ABC transporter ATP-binding protein [Desulfuromonadales bacterium]